MDQNQPGQQSSQNITPPTTQAPQTPTNPDEPVIIEEQISQVNGDIAIKQYQKGKLLGKGGFAKCFQVVNLETKKTLAAKIIPKATLVQNRARQKLISEIQIHQSLHNANIVEFEHVFEDHEAVYILLELCPNQTLNELIKRRKRLSELQVQCYTLQIIQALRYLRQNRVIHRDLKLGNLFLGADMDVKLGDFGLATKLEFEGQKKRTICGTPNYIAPEILDGQTGHSYEVDIWSLGVIIYTLLIGQPPFETPEVKTTYKMIRMNKYSFPEHVQISDSSRNLITSILNLDPLQRPLLEDIFAHPFLNAGANIPKTMPISTLACPPPNNFLKQYQTQSQSQLSQPPTSRTSNVGTNGGTLDNNALNIAITGPTQLNGIASAATLTNKDRGGLLSSDQYQPTNTIGAGVGGSNGGKLNSDFGKTTTGNFKSTGTNDLDRPRTNNDKQMKGSMSTQNYGIKPSTSGGAGPSQNNNYFAPMPGGPSNIPSYANYTKTEPGSINMTTGMKVNSEVWVKQWVDYSSQYGLGYMLSNGCSGVFFNDSSKIILDPTNTFFDYMERKGQDKQDVVNTHLLNEYPKELSQKVTLLQHFRQYLESDPVMSVKTEENNMQQGQLVYVKKWMKTRHAIMFRLSNKIVQVNFHDKTEILLSSENRQVTYVNKKGERSTYPLASALESQNQEMSQRLQYTQEILSHMLTNSQKNQGANPGANGEQQVGGGENPTA